MRLWTFIMRFVLLMAPTVQAVQLCNGFAELCNRSYGNVSFIGAHDSAFYSEIDIDVDIVLTADQHYDVTTQLDAGIRLLQSQGHNSTSQVPGGIELCHTSCLLYDGGPLVDYLQTVKTWLDANPNEVLTILFTNPDGVNISVWGQDFISTGIAAMAYIPPFNNTPTDTYDWPTLGSMIDSGSRVVIFLDAGADQDIVDFILPEFNFMWETPFDQTNQSFPCNVDRPPYLQGQFPQGRLAVINHFLDIELPGDTLIPDEGEASVTNGVQGFGSLGLQAQQCAAIYGRYPNFFLVDYYDEGNVFAVANFLNGVNQTNGTNGTTLHSGGSLAEAPTMFSLLKLLFVSFVLSMAWLAWDGW